MANGGRAGGRGKKGNPFIFYCLERQALDSSLKGKSMSELVEICGPDWAVLPVYERTPYLTSAQDPFNVRMEEDIRGRFDSFGRSLVALEKEKQDEKENRERLRKDLWRNISTLRKKGKLSGQRFHFLHINHWTETDQQVFPAELGLVQMTLQDGVTDIFHQKIDPGTSLPLGFKGQIREWSEKTHGLWLDNPELSDNYQEILDKIISVLKIKNDESPALGSDNLLPIFVNSDLIWSAEKSLDWLLNRCSVKNDVKFIFYESHLLFWELVGSTSYNINKSVIATPMVAKATLEKDIFLYTPGVSCEYHENCENCHCAGAIASRPAFIISDYCCEMYNIDLIEGQHIPVGVVSPPEEETNFYYSVSSFKEEGNFKHVWSEFMDNSWNKRKGYKKLDLSSFESKKNITLADDSFSSEFFDSFPHLDELSIKTGLFNADKLRDKNF